MTQQDPGTGDHLEGGDFQEGLRLFFLEPDRKRIE